MTLRTVFSSILFVLSFFLFIHLLFPSETFAATGSIRVCMVIADGNGYIVDGSALSGSFRLNWRAPSQFDMNEDACEDADWDELDPVNNLCPATAVPSSTTFTTPLSLNTNLTNFPPGPTGGDNARCTTYSNLSVPEFPDGVDYGYYFYNQLSVTGSGWNAPKYNDGYNSSISVSNLYNWDNAWYDSDPNNRPNLDSDGGITLGASSRNYNRTLLLFNQYGGNAPPTIRPTITPTRTPTPTPTRTGTPTPTCTPTASVNLSPSTTNASRGQTIPFTAGLSGVVTCGNTVRVDFSSNNSGLVAIAPPSDSSSPYLATATVTTNTSSSGTATITARVFIGGVQRAIDTSTVTVPVLALPSCSFTLLPVSANMSVGGVQDYTVSNITVQNGTIDNVEFVSDDPTAVSVSPSTDSIATYRTTATGVTNSTATTITADMFVGGDTTPTCSATAGASVIAALSPWWQIIESDVITNGDISSTIPASCTGVCDNSFITYTSNSSPGIASANGSVDSGNGPVSDTGWNANSGYNGTAYTYDYFERRSVCGPINELTDPSIDSLADLTSGTQSEGYYWVRYTGGSPLSLDTDLNLGNTKIVLLVKNTDFLINGDIQLNNGNGSLLTIVQNNIQINPSVSGSQESTPIADIEGVFFAGGQFRTGTLGPGLDQQLHIRGSVVAMDRILLQRDLVSNDTVAAELFEYAPDLLLQFPSCLAEKSVKWQELAP